MSSDSYVTHCNVFLFFFFNCLKLSLQNGACGHLFSQVCFFGGVLYFLHYQRIVLLDTVSLIEV